MAWWHYLTASIEAVLLAVLVLLWYDSLRERPGWTLRRASMAALRASIAVPIGFLVVLVMPLWAALILIAIPALAVITMALVS